MNGNHSGEMTAVGRNGNHTGKGSSKTNGVNAANMAPGHKGAANMPAGAVSESYTPIKSLNTFLFDWKIKARVTKKHNKKTWKNNRG